MRLNPILKYKIYYQSKKILIEPSLRLLKFKRTKWKLIQENITKKAFLFKKQFFFEKSKLNKPRYVKNSFRNNFSLKVRTKAFIKLRSIFKLNLQAKRHYKQLFDNAISLQRLNLLRSNFYKTKFTNTLIKPYFKLDILLWKLHFYNSCYEAQQCINNGLILVNDIKVKPHFFLKKGDIIKIGLSNSFSFNMQKRIRDTLLVLSKDSIFFPFLEIDYYTKTIVIVKGLEELSKDDFYLFNSTYFDLKSLS